MTLLRGVSSSTLSLHSGFKPLQAQCREHGATEGLTIITWQSPPIFIALILLLNINPEDACQSSLRSASYATPSNTISPTSTSVKEVLTQKPAD